jgi:hypothetical protein
MEQAFGDHGDHQVSLGAGFGGEQSIEAEAADGAEDGLDVAVGEGAVDMEVQKPTTAVTTKELGPKPLRNFGLAAKTRPVVIVSR